MRRLLCLSVLALTAAACDSGADAAPALSGLYVYSETDADLGTTVTLTLDLSAPAGAFTLGPRSSYRLAGAAGSGQAAVSGSGTYDPPSVTVRLDAIDRGEGFVLDAATFTGTVSDDGGTVSLSGDGETLTLLRQ